MLVSLNPFSCRRASDSPQHCHCGLSKYKEYHKNTLEIAADKVSKDLELGMGSKSIERQAYKIRAMLGHLQRMRREKRERSASVAVAVDQVGQPTDHCTCSEAGDQERPHQSGSS